MLATGTIGLLIGWAVRSGRVNSSVGRLEAEAAQTKADCARHEEQAAKLRTKNQKLEKRLQELEKGSAPREQLESAQASLVEAQKELGKLRRERDTARVELEGFKEAAVSGAEHSNLKRVLDRREGELRQAKAEADKRARELAAIQAREVHDLVGFEDDRDDRIRDLTLENARLREILAKVQAGDKKSILQLADEARRGVAAAAAVEAGADPAMLAALREENARLSGELETAKKKLLLAKAGEAVGSGTQSFAIERERDALKVELARLKAAGTGTADSGLQAELTAARKERDALARELVAVKGGAHDTPAEEASESNLAEGLGKQSD